MLNLWLLRLIMLFSLLFVIAICGYAQDQCSDVLRDGVFNQYTRLNQSNYKLKLKEGIVDSREETTSATNTGSLSLTLPVEGLPIPIKLGGQADLSRYRQIKTKYQRNTSLQIQQDDLEFILSRVASDRIIDAWSLCMHDKASLKGLQADTEMVDELKFNLKVRWVAVQNVNSVLVKDFIVSGAKCEPRLLKPRTVINSELVSQPCVRTGAESVQMTINVITRAGVSADAKTPKLNAVPAPAITFTASRESIQPGQVSVLSWNVTNATTVTIQPGSNINRGLSGETTVQPDATTTYILTASGIGGTNTKPLPITVAALPPVLKITSLQAFFFTQDDDKDRGDGVSERFTFSNQVVGENHSWGNGLIFRDNSPDNGQEFAVSIPFDQCNAIKYEYRMDNDDGWHVQFELRAKLSNGTTAVLKKTGTINIANGNPNSGTIDGLCQ